MAWNLVEDLRVVQGMRRRAAIAAIIGMTGVVGVMAARAGACGGLVGENGTIELVRTTTLAAYSDGIERYITAFAFTGQGAEVGSIVPLPDVPNEVVRGGEWTLPRLVQEVRAVPAGAATTAASAGGSSAAEAEVLLETTIDALDITVLRGGGDAVGAWATEHGFLLTPDAPEVLDFYAARSPVFMAARFDAERVRALGQGIGDSTPIMATIPTDTPWVPLRILGLGLEDQRRVQADVFVLTEDEPELLVGGSGTTVQRSEAASPFLLDDLRSDVGMAWMPEEMWLSYLTVASPAAELDYDLAMSVTEAPPALADAGITEIDAVPLSPDAGSSPAVWPAVAGVGAGAVAIVAVSGYGRARRRR